MGGKINSKSLLHGEMLLELAEDNTCGRRKEEQKEKKDTTGGMASHEAKWTEIIPVEKCMEDTLAKTF